MATELFHLFFSLTGCLILFCFTFVYRWVVPQLFYADISNKRLFQIGKEVCNTCKVMLWGAGLPGWHWEAEMCSIWEHREHWEAGMQHTGAQAGEDKRWAQAGTGRSHSCKQLHRGQLKKQACLGWTRLALGITKRTIYHKVRCHLALQTNQDKGVWVC